MDKDCLFCKLVSGELPSHKVYEDDHSCAWMDIKPVRPGHILVVPKQHIEEFLDLDDESYAKIMLAVKRISDAVKLTYNPPKVGLAISGFEIPHTHIHIIPLYESTDLTSKLILDGTREPQTDEALARAAEQIKSAIK